MNHPSMNLFARGLQDIGITVNPSKLQVTPNKLGNGSKGNTIVMSKSAEKWKNKKKIRRISAPSKESCGIFQALESDEIETSVVLKESSLIKRTPLTEDSDHTNIIKPQTEDVDSSATMNLKSGSSLPLLNRGIFGVGGMTKAILSSCNSDAKGPVTHENEIDDSKSLDTCQSRNLCKELFSSSITHSTLPGISAENKPQCMIENVVKESRNTIDSPARSYHGYVHNFQAIPRYNRKPRQREKKCLAENCIHEYCKQHGNGKYRRHSFSESQSNLQNTTNAFHQGNRQHQPHVYSDSYLVRSDKFVDNAYHSENEYFIIDGPLDEDVETRDSFSQDGLNNIPLIQIIDSTTKHIVQRCLHPTNNSVIQSKHTPTSKIMDGNTAASHMSNLSLEDQQPISVAHENCDIRVIVDTQQQVNCMEGKIALQIPEHSNTDSGIHCSMTISHDNDCTTGGNTSAVESKQCNTDENDNVTDYFTVKTPRRDSSSLDATPLIPVDNFGQTASNDVSLPFRQSRPKMYRAPYYVAKDRARHVSNGQPFHLQSHSFTARFNPPAQRNVLLYPRHPSGLMQRSPYARAASKKKFLDVEPSGDTTYSKFLEVEKRDDSHLYSTAHKRRKSGENLFLQMGACNTPPSTCNTPPSTCNTPLSTCSSTSESTPDWFTTDTIEKIVQYKNLHSRPPPPLAVKTEQPMPWKYISSKDVAQSVNLGAGRPSLPDVPNTNNDNWKANFRHRFKNADVPFIDSHCHLDKIFSRTAFKGRSFAAFKFQNQETFLHNFEACVAIFCDPRQFSRKGGLWKTLLDNESDVYGAAGCHPKSASAYNNEVDYHLEGMLQHDKMVALGEIGLDYSGIFYTQRETQISVLKRQLKLAKNLCIPVVIHCRDAHSDCINVLKETLEFDHKIHLHCFVGTASEAQEWFDAFPKLYVGFTPLITGMSQRAKQLREVVKQIPLHKVLLETDSPYFVPGFIQKHELEHSHPGFAITVAEMYSKLNSVPLNEVLAQCRDNTKNMYSI